ncbi:hypothetical protein LQR31_06315 [Chromobacterium vaccinii]|uniref:hypothetical protein n=1 Tax=Chromobacterium vaccinii TaxID=1108595 RepID=UPI001E36F2D2|nr:hypothetical protein [Chromobacterium vaccinii]MCD4484091.1 hypothetical protein [Chromobacterium vaccinii]
MSLCAGLAKFGFALLCLGVVGCAVDQRGASDPFKGVSETVSLMLEEEKKFNANHSLEGMTAADAESVINKEGFVCRIMYARVPVSLAPLRVVDKPNVYCLKEEPRLKSYCPYKQVVMSVRWVDGGLPINRLYLDAQVSLVESARFYCRLKSP